MFVTCLYKYAGIFKVEWLKFWCLIHYKIVYLSSIIFLNQISLFFFITNINYIYCKYLTRRNNSYFLYNYLQHAVQIKSMSTDRREYVPN